MCPDINNLVITLIIGNKPHVIIIPNLIYFFLSHIKGLDEADSLALVDRLCRQFEITEYQCRFRWEPGSVAFWDNRAVQHYAASDYYPHKRLLRRVTVSGDEPYYDPAGTARGV